MSQSTRANLMLFILIVVATVLATVAVQNSTWRGTAGSHNAMETIATYLATFVGILGFIRFAARKNWEYLFLGAGFLGTAVLDGYHGLTTYRPGSVIRFLCRLWNVLRVISFSKRPQTDDHSRIGKLKREKLPQILIAPGRACAVLSKISL